MSTTASQRALDYLEQLPGTTFTKLYQQPSTALAIFRRMLPHLAKNIVMAMLYMPAQHPAAPSTPHKNPKSSEKSSALPSLAKLPGIAPSDLDAWIRPDAESVSRRDQALSVLQRLRILYESEADGGVGMRRYVLSEAFARSLRMALTGGGNHRSFGVACGAADVGGGVGGEEAVEVAFLDEWARKQWEAILYYVVGSASAGLSGAEQEQQGEISAGTKQLLQKGEFVTIRGRTAQITEKGFSFLLQEVNAQVWTLLVVYLEVSGELQMDAVDVLSFLFTLGSLELGTAYSTSNLSPTQHQMLEDLADFGLLYRPTGDSTRYYPTRLATTLTSSAPALPSTTTSTTTSSSGSNNSIAEGEKGHIILETNYRLYAYTSSPLPITILSLFASLSTRYPNLITAKITKSSIQSAIAQGITSAQIITYLTTHAHPILRRHHEATGAPILPPTVVDQIRLWQIEGERMTSWRGYLIRDVGGKEEYDKAVAYAEALGVLRREFRAKGWFFVTRMEQMSVYFKAQAGRRREAMAAQQALQQGGQGSGGT